MPLREGPAPPLSGISDFIWPSVHSVGLRHNVLTIRLNDPLKMIKSIRTSALSLNRDVNWCLLGRTFKESGCAGKWPWADLMSGLLKASHRQSTENKTVFLTGSCQSDANIHCSVNQETRHPMPHHSSQRSPFRGLISCPTFIVGFE